MFDRFGRCFELARPKQQQAVKADPLYKSPEPPSFCHSRLLNRTLTELVTAPTTRPKTQKDAKRFRFLELPAELRNRIYDYALPDHQELRIPTRVDDPEPSGFLLSSGAREPGQVQSYLADEIHARGILLGEPPLLRVSHQIRNEVAPMHYKRTTFITDNQQVLLGWLHLLASARRRLVKSCVLDFNCWNDPIGLAWTTNVFDNVYSRVAALDLRLPAGALKLELPDRTVTKIGAGSKRVDIVQALSLLREEDRQKNRLLFVVRHQFAALDAEELQLLLSGLVALR